MVSARLMHLLKSERARILDLLCTFDETGRVIHRVDLVVLGMEDEGWHVKVLQILRLVSFRKCLDAFVRV